MDDAVLRHMSRQAQAEAMRSAMLAQVAGTIYARLVPDCMYDAGTGTMGQPSKMCEDLARWSLQAADVLLRQMETGRWQERPTDQ